MNKLQYFLSKLAEESAKLSQIALKAQQFGINEFYEHHRPVMSNIERINIEFNDLLAIVEEINAIVGAKIIFENRILIDNKKPKLKHFLNYSIECGCTNKKEKDSE